MGEFDYKIPKDVLAKIPDYFWAGLAGELVGVWSLDIFEKADEKTTYIDFHGGTMGWAAAFKMACKKLDMQWLYDYYDALEWWESDHFDGEIIDLLKYKFIDADTPQHPSSYYLWLIGKE